MQYNHRGIGIGRCVVLQQVAQHGNEAACKRWLYLQGKNSNPLWVYSDNTANLTDDQYMLY